MASVLRPIWLFSLILTLSACGGGSGDSDPQVLAEIPLETSPVNVTSNDPETNVPVEENSVVENTTEETVIEEQVVEEPVAVVFPPVFTTPAGVEQCSTEDINARVEFDMLDYYIFYNQVPSLDLAEFDDPNDLVRALRIDPDVFSSVRDAADAAALTSGISGGFGFFLSEAGDGNIRVRDILNGSPANQSGLLRGDLLLAIDGISLDVITGEQVDVAFDPENAPINLLVQTGEDEPRTLDVAFEDFRWVTAGPATRFSSDDPNLSLPVVGYLPISAFLGNTVNEIDAALASLEASGGFDDLIVDLRYNGGGLVSAARHIASVVGGAAVQNEPFLFFLFNDKYEQFNSVDIFDFVPEPLNLPRVFVLTTGRSASSSELFINSLKPFIDVVVVGEPTFGKPFISRPRDYCGKSINIMEILNTNAAGVSVSLGIQPDCPVTDDFQTLANSVQDPLLSGALSFIRNGTCELLVAEAAPTRNSANSNFIYEPPQFFPAEQQ